MRINAIQLSSMKTNFQGCRGKISYKVRDGIVDQFRKSIFFVQNCCGHTYFVIIIKIKGTQKTN